MRVKQLSTEESQKVTKTTLCHLKLIIVEISMVSSLKLAYMHLRLEELFGGDTWFGCRNITLFGIYCNYNPSVEAILHKLGCVTSINIIIVMERFSCTR